MAKLIGFVFLAVVPLGMADIDTATQFVKHLKEENYLKAYDLLSPDLKSQIFLTDFERNQKQIRKEFASKYGTTETVIRVEEIFIGQSSPLLNENTLKRLLPFRNNTPPKSQSRIFQFIFAEGKSIVFGVDTIDSGNRAVISNYEFLPELQAYLSSGAPRNLSVKVQEIA